MYFHEINLIQNTKWQFPRKYFPLPYPPVQHDHPSKFVQNSETQLFLEKYKKKSQWDQAKKTYLKKVYKNKKMSHSIILSWGQVQEPNLKLCVV